MTSLRFAPIQLLVAFFLAYVVSGFTGLQITPASASNVTCDCEESACGPCEIETGTTFYSAKCGLANSRVKSCKKATCEPVENQKQCLAVLQQAPPSSEVLTIENNESVANAREPSSSGRPAGTIQKVSGSVQIHRQKGASSKAKQGAAVFEGDEIETRGDSKISIVLSDQSELIVQPNTRLRVNQVHVQVQKDARQISLALLMGKVRSRVSKKYDGDNYYRVQTKTAVAGVRGTDFVTSFEPGAKEWITEVRTIEGRVKLGAVDAQAEGGISNSKTVEVGAGHHAAFITEVPKSQHEDHLEIATRNGFITPVFGIKEDDIRLLKDTTDFKSLQTQAPGAGKRTPASATSSGVCAEPTGEFNQCSFSCEGNPKGSKKCRIDLPGVKCVRRLCRANGAWAEPTRMPASQSDYCQPQKTVVRDCGGYW